MLVVLGKTAGISLPKFQQVWYSSTNMKSTTHWLLIIPDFPIVLSGSWTGMQQISRTCVGNLPTNLYLVSEFIPFDGEEWLRETLVIWSEFGFGFTLLDLACF